jgi:hypothetical protein
MEVLPLFVLGSPFLDHSLGVTKAADFRADSPTL